MEYDILMNNTLTGLVRMVNTEINTKQFQPLGAPFWMEREQRYMQAGTRPGDTPTPQPQAPAPKRRP